MVFSIDWIQKSGLSTSDAFEKWLNIGIHCIIYRNEVNIFNLFTCLHKNKPECLRHLLLSKHFLNTWLRGCPLDRNAAQMNLSLIESCLGFHIQMDITHVDYVGSSQKHQSRCSQIACFVWVDKANQLNPKNSTIICERSYLCFWWNPSGLTVCAWVTIQSSLRKGQIWFYHHPKCFNMDAIGCGVIS